MKMPTKKASFAFVLCFLGASLYMWVFVTKRSPTIFNPPSMFSFMNRQGGEPQILVVGGGLSGAVIAHLHATLLGKRVLLVEQKSHIGGSCYDYVDEHGIRVSKYGLHVFHTNNELVWRYLSQFSKWTSFEHRVVAKIDDSYVPIPGNIDTMNALFNLSIMNSADMVKWLKDHPFEKLDKKDKQLEMLNLLSKTFEYYSPKGCYNFSQHPNPSHPQQMPIRDDFDDRCFPSAIHTVLPSDGYTALIKQMLDHPLITVKFNVEFHRPLNEKLFSHYNFSKIFYTGPIDAYFISSGLEKLAYRYVNFETIHVNKTLFQPGAVVDYPQDKQKGLRIVEYKNLINTTVSSSTIVKQYFVDKGYPYYPVNDEHNKQLYGKYEKLAKEEEHKSNVYFVGGLARYEYLNIDETVMNAIKEFKRVCSDSGKLFPDKNIFPISVPDTSKGVHTDKPSIAVVTSHCKEKITWIETDLVPLCADNDVNIFIYEKCGQTTQGLEIRKKNPKCNIHQFELPNVGREGHTWLHYMITQNARFSDIQFFVQGGKEMSKKIMFDKLDTFKKIDNLRGPGYLKTPSDKLGSHYSPRAGIGCFDLNYKYLDWTAAQIRSKLCDYYFLITKTRVSCHRFRVNYRGEFVVTGALLHRVVARHRHVMITWYNDLANGGNNPVNGHIIERSWTLLFNFPVIPHC